MLLAGNFAADFVTSEDIPVAAAKNMTDGLELLKLLLRRSPDAKAMGKEKDTEVPIEREEESQSLNRKDRKLCITEKILVAAAENYTLGIEKFECLLRYDPEIQITAAVADAIMSNRFSSRRIRRLLLSKFRGNLTQEALTKFEHNS